MTTPYESEAMIPGGRGAPRRGMVMDRRSMMLQSKKASLQPDRRGTFFGDQRISIVGDPKVASEADKLLQKAAAPKNRGRLLFENKISESFMGVYSLRYSHNGENLATAFGAGAIQVRNGSTGVLKNTLRSAMDNTFPIMCVRYHPNITDQFFAASACGSLFVCNAVEGLFTKFVEEKGNQINSVDINLSGEVLATGGKDAVIRIYDPETSQKIMSYDRFSEIRGEIQSKYHRMRIFSVYFHPTHRTMLLTGGWDDTVKIWDTRLTGGCVREVKGPHICGDAIDVRENVIVTGSWVVSNSLETWDFLSGKKLDTINPSNRPWSMDGEFLYTAHYFDGDPYGEMVVVGGSGVAAVEVISIKEQKIMGHYNVNKTVQATDSHGQLLAFGGMEPVLRIGDFA